MADSRTLSVGVIGMGGMGTRHALNLHWLGGAAHVAAVYDVDVERARLGAERCGSAAVFDDPLQLIQDDRVDAVVVASPDATHAGFVLECLRCRKPVLCEKPLATSAAQAAKVVDAERALGRRLTAVGFMRRFDPQHLAVRRIVESGQLGRPILYRGVHRNATIPYQASGEVVVANSASHDIDAARWLLKQEVEEVYVRAVRTHASFGAETLDLVLLQMSLSGDCLATMEVFVAAEYGYEVSAEIVAERGTALAAQPGYAVVRSQRARSVAVPGDWLERFQDAYVGEVSEWVNSIRAERPFAGANAWDGYVSLLVADVCVRSLRDGTPAPVLTPARPDLYRVAGDSEPEG